MSSNPPIRYVGRFKKFCPVAAQIRMNEEKYEAKRARGSRKSFLIKKSAMQNIATRKSEFKNISNFMCESNARRNPIPATPKSIIPGDPFWVMTRYRNNESDISSHQNGILSVRITYSRGIKMR
ncbi:MAG: hypothetical protein WCK53_11055 [Methanomicrobiales archaeon]